MPLPDPSVDGAVSWPPKQLANVWPKLQEWSAWYGADANTLARHYGTFGNPVAPRPRPGQFAGGVYGAVSRMFWGAPLGPGQQRTKLHMPIAGDIATASADLLFSESIKITVPEDVAAANPKAQARLETILDGNSFESLLVEQGELNAALGGVFLRVVFDRAIEPNHPLITVVHADGAWPEFRYGRLTAVTFWQVVDTTADGQKVMRLLERHDPGRIEYGLFEGTADQLGRRIDLGGHTEARSLVDQVDADSGQSTGWANGLAAVYVPNMKPTRGAWRTDPLGCNLGRSDFDTIEPLMDAADETLTSWMRDVRLGKGRIIVPNYMLNTGKRGDASTFNIDQEVFTGLAVPPAGDTGGAAKDMTVQQFEIRTEQHANTLKGILAAAFRSAGYSQQTFGMADEAAATATEVTAREGRSAATREKKSRYYGDGLARLVRALVSIDTAEFNGGAGRDWLPQVEFPAYSRPSQSELATTLQTLRAAELLSIHTGVSMAHPDWDEPTVAEEVARIVADRPAVVPAFGPLPDDPASTEPEDLERDDQARPPEPR